MSPIATASVAFALILASMVFGAVLRLRLPEHHLTGDSKDVMKLATAFVATMAALVLALLFASTRASFNQNSAAVSRLTADVVALDKLLAEYGPEARPIRAALRADIKPIIDTIWRENADDAEVASAIQADPLSALMHRLRKLAPQSEAQTSIKARALQVGDDLLQTHLGLFAQPADTISATFIVVLIFWLMFIFASFSLSATPNFTLLSMLFFCVLSASSAIYLILELGLPFGGLMEVSAEGLRTALTALPGKT